jgi:hypothetical protein
MAFVRAYMKPGNTRTVVYQDEKGDKILYQNGSRSWRTNNPGNIAKSTFATKQGAIGDDGINAIFPDVATGHAALEALLKGLKYLNSTIPDAFARYAPASENDPKAYSAFILKKTGLAPDRTLASLTGGEFIKILAAIQGFEGWREGKIIAGA